MFVEMTRCPAKAKANLHLSSGMHNIYGTNMSGFHDIRRHLHNTLPFWHIRAEETRTMPLALPMRLASGKASAKLFPHHDPRRPLTFQPIGFICACTIYIYISYTGRQSRYALV